MYPGTQFYGIKEIFLSHAKLPLCLPFPTAVLHGWQRVTHEFETSTNPPEIWVWSPRIAADLEKFYPRERIRVVGSFFCYLVKSIPNHFPSEQRRGSVCIPPHSSHLAKSIYSTEVFAKSLNDLSDEYKPIRVMLYYLDINEQVVHTYEKYGFQVVSNGELYDINFLKNFFKNVQDKKYCIFSDLGSGVLYSLYLNLIPYHLNLPTEVLNLGNKYINDKSIFDSMKFDQDFLKLINNPSNIKAEMGESYLLSRNEMRLLILKNYFTWRFMKTFTRRLAGAFLRYLKLRMGRLNLWTR